ncbi:hypothetical protein EDC94DRAFT_650450, partial [Helicostylum pulchrum]
MSLENLPGINEEYDGCNLNKYKGIWRRLFKSFVKKLKLTLENSETDSWNDTVAKKLKETNDKSASSSTTCKSTTSSNYKLSDLEKNRVLDSYDAISTSCKWILSTAPSALDDIRHRRPYLEKFFTETELNEIRQYRAHPLPNILEDLQDYLDTYDKQWKSGKELFNFADMQHHDPVTNFDKKWIKESFVRMSELFLHSNQLEFNDSSEADLLHDVWPFIYRAFKDKEVRALLGERASVAVALARNEERSIEVTEKRPRKSMGAKVDILFKTCGNEYGVCEAGKDDVTIADDKYIDDGLVKLPKTLRDMLSLLVQKNPDQVNNLYTIGFLVMEVMSIDFLPLLELTWRGFDLASILSV